MKDLSGNVAVITGAGNGIGAALARELGAAGMAVAVSDLDGDAAERVAHELQTVGVRATAVPTDVRRLDDVRLLAERASAELGSVRLLVNNAGVGLIEPLATITEEDYRWVMDVNYFGVVNGLLAFLPDLIELDGERHIVNTASMSGFSTSIGLAGYNASKFAVVGLTEALAEEVRVHGIGVSMLCPGVVGTGIMGRSRKLRSQQSRPAAPLPRSAEQGDWSQVRVVDAVDAARLVVHAIRNDELYVFTHAESRATLVTRFDRILAAFDR
jgi:NAD(P)-dependent dehydrogenase (short-subunit alcohol dehydrogenase family)